ncbi:MAG: GNAT family N-acetyltransferase [Burkholderiaceae bacterium]|nr:GNAT family N-acetyltransferase [Rhodoferax sp.]MCP5286227.1 GNAT family N-acetyltransferase [Burkholderiaceae bacterium]
MAGIAFREPEVEDAARILRWRTDPRVAAMMTGEVADDLAAQQRWLEACRTRPDYCHWIVEIGGEPAGLLSLAGYQPESRRSSWGFYIGDESRLGFGGFIPPHFYNWAFGRLGLETLDAEVFEQNRAVIDLHRLHGYRERPEADRTVLKQGESRRLVALSLHRDDWNRQRYRRFDADFPTATWAARPAHLAVQAG